MNYREDDPEDWVFDPVDRSYEQHMSERFFIGRDESGQRYLVPVHNYHPWHEFLEEQQYTEDVPGWAKPIDGGVLTFSEPRMERL